MALGKTADDIYRNTKPAATTGRKSKAKAEEPVTQGRERKHAEGSWAQVTVVLLNRQTALLDRLRGDVRERQGKSMARAEIIRALIDALGDSGLDVAKYGTEAELREALTAKLKR